MATQSPNDVKAAGKDASRKPSKPAKKKDAKNNHVGMPIDLSKIDPKKIKMAEDFGIPIGQILQWMASVEARFEAIQKEMPERIKGAMTAAIEDAQKKQVAQAQQMMAQNPASGGGLGAAGLGQLIPMLLGGGGGQDPEIANLTKEIMKESLLSMRRKADITDRFMDAVISNIGGKIASQTIKKATGE